MTEKPSPPTLKELADMPENEFLELSRDCDRIDSEYAFKDAGREALVALGNGALSIGLLVAGAVTGAPPYALLGAAPNAILAGVSVWNGIQALGEGVRKSSQSASADTILKVLYAPEPPGAVIHEAEAYGKVKSPSQQTIGRT
jgi:hypothetical protein